VVARFCVLAVPATCLTIPMANAQKPENLARKAAAVTASTCRPEYPPPGAIDGDMGTSFSVALGASKNQWLKMEWTKPQRIGGLAFFQPDRYTQSLDVEVLEAGKWVKVAHAGPPGKPLGVNFFVTFEPRETTALRLSSIDSTTVGGAAYYEIEAYSDPKVVLDMQNKIDIAVAGDTTGRLVGTVSQESGAKGVVGAKVSVSGTSPAGAWTRQAETKDHGLFVVDLPLNPTDVIRVAATQGELKGELEVESSDIAQRLTPRPTEGRIGLDGKWDFLTDPPKDFQNKTAGLAWVPLKVPSNYEMEGHTTETDTAAYRKALKIPKEWAGKPIRLRAEAIYSQAEVWLNGKRVGSHDGGATPFELDLTDAAKPGGANELCILVHARSKAAKIDNMSVYAYFEVAGIWRSIEVFAVEPTHIGRLTYSTVFDKDYKDATLSVDVKVVNEQGKKSDAKLNVHVVDPKGKELKLDGLKAEIALKPWEAKIVTLTAKVKKPEQWNAELPRSYKIVAELEATGQAQAKVEQPLGFRQVEIKGRCFTINGKPVRLFGSCMHSADPLLGRAVTVELVKQDLELMKGANLNAIRTSHYPPHPAMPAMADQIGLYIEDEGPSCWGDDSEDLRDAPRYIGIVSEYMERDRNHPSVVYWSTCNESHYGIIFQLAHRYAKQLDPTRPVGGSYAPEEMDNDVFVIHHPTNTAEHIEQTKNISKPVFYDECLTVFHGWGDFAYSLEIDPGMHDYWETGMLGIRRQEMKYENQVGTMIWAWVDDAFCIPGRGIGYWRRDLPQIRYTDSVYKMPGRGYQGDCVWGMVDGWRRPRPEWWLAKKIYTPILIEEKPLALPSAGKPIVVPVENMNWFSNLGIYECRWEIAGRKGKSRADVGPSSKGMLEIAPPVALSGDEVLALEWHDETGRLVDAYKLRFKGRQTPTMKLGKPAAIKEENGRYLSGAKAVYLKGGSCEVGYDKASGKMMWALKDNEQVMLTGPTLHILKGENPMGDDPVGWKFAEESHEPGLIRWNGSFGEEFKGGYEIQMDVAGQMEFRYSFVYSGPDVSVRELGLKFEVPLQFDRLAWDRAADHSVYPDDHIGRPVGQAMAHAGVPQTVPPNGRPFGLDDHPWGSNDFRSAKRNLLRGALTNAEGQGLEVVSDGTQTLRCILGPHFVTVHVLDFYGGTGGPKEWSVLGFHYGPGKWLKAGDKVEGVVRMRMLGKGPGAPLRPHWVHVASLSPDAAAWSKVGSSC
jgi:beta-galactosidase